MNVFDDLNACCAHANEAVTVTFAHVSTRKNYRKITFFIVSCPGLEPQSSALVNLAASNFSQHLAVVGVIAHTLSERLTFMFEPRFIESRPSRFRSTVIITACSLQGTVGVITLHRKWWNQLNSDVVENFR